jgi:CheY-like chemotaxis protein
MPSYLRSLHQHRSTPNASRRHSILVVEDNFFVRALAAEIFQDHGFTVIEAHNADEALVSLRSDVIDLVFTDIEMPGSMNGLALARLVREKRPDVKIVVASGHIRSKGDLKLADAWISKPYKPEHAALIIDDLLGGGGVSEPDRFLMSKLEWESAID